MKRISVYLEEDEVDAQVSSLKRDASAEPNLRGEDDAGLGLEHADLVWNEIPSDADSEAANGATEVAEESEHGRGGGTEGDLEAAHANDGEQLQSPTEQPRFELKDVTVRFPEGKLTVVTGPTASGKTALLVCPCHIHVDTPC